VLQLCEGVTGDEGLFELQIGVWNIGGGQAARKVVDREQHLLGEGSEDGNVTGAVLQNRMGGEELRLR
jgi:hypothetical protein